MVRKFDLRAERAPAPFPARLHHDVPRYHLSDGLSVFVSGEQSRPEATSPSLIEQVIALAIFLVPAEVLAVAAYLAFRSSTLRCPNRSPHENEVVSASKSPPFTYSVARGARTSAIAGDCRVPLAVDHMVDV